MKIFFDFFPLLVFFGMWLAVDIFFATGAAMVATTIQVVWSGLKYRKIDKMLWINFGAILFFGGLTLVLHDKRFIMIKPTIVYWILASTLLIAYAGFGKNLIKMMMEAQFDAPARLWNRWLFGWVAYFAGLGVVNLLVAWNFSEAVWATFKVFGALTLSIVLTAALVWSLMPYARNEEAKAPSPNEDSPGS
jgi:intracellular septation protein